MHTKLFEGGARIHYNSDMSGLVRIEHGEGLNAYTIAIPGAALMRWFLELPLSAFGDIRLDLYGEAELLDRACALLRKLDDAERKIAEASAWEPGT